MPQEGQLTRELVHQLACLLCERRVFDSVYVRLDQSTDQKWKFYIN